MARLKLKVQLLCGDQIAMGPGKADLLQAIDHDGSISAAARSMGMSYRRAWMLVDTMNRCFAEPLVMTTPGGGRRAGAVLSEAGRQALGAYRQLTRQVEAASRDEAFEALQQAIRETPSGSPFTP